MKDVDRIVEVFLDHDGEIRPVGRMRCTPARRRERVLFEYDPSWIVRQDHFAIDQGLPVVAGPFQPAHDAEMFPVLGDSAPDNWGRILATSIDYYNDTCDLNLVLDVAEEFALSPAEARAIIRETAVAVADWRDVARAQGTPAREISYMESAFEHEDMELAKGV